MERVPAAVMFAVTVTRALPDVIAAVVAGFTPGVPPKVAV
jgi:hypothetical protein